MRHFVGANGRVDSTRTFVGAQAAVTRFRYDTRGRPDSVVDAEGHLQARTWYAGTNGNRSKDSLPGGHVTTYGYDSYGRRTSVSPPALAARIATYDVLNRVLRDSVAGLPATVHAYDSLFLRSVTDPKGQVYKFATNAVGWTTARTDPANRADTLRYDREGLLRKWRNRRGQTMVYVYDNGHRPSSRTGTNADSLTWAYSSPGTVAAARSPWAIDSVFADSGRVDSTRTRFVGVGSVFVQRFRYLQVGPLDSVDVVGGGIPFMTRKYLWDTNAGALSAIRLGSGGSTTLGLNRDLQLSGATFPGGDQVAHSYTAVHGEAQIASAAPYAESVSRFLAFDVVGRIWRQVNGDARTGWEYTYDPLGRLVAVDPIAYDGPEPPPCEPPNPLDERGLECVQEEGEWIVHNWGSAFSYDSVGNRRDQGGTYGVGNRIRAFAGCTYVTDSLGDGNVLARTCESETVRFHWSAESRLAALKVVGGDSLDFRYDAGGRLVRKDVNGAAASHFLWQGDNLLAEVNGGASAKVAEYSYYPGLDHPHAVITGTTPHFAHVDGAGNVIALTDSAPNIQRFYGWGPWGALTASSDLKPFNDADRARFKGALWLGPQVDLYYMRNRGMNRRAGAS